MRARLELGGLVLAAWALGASTGCGWKLRTREAPAAESGSEAGEAGEGDALASEFSLPSDQGGHVSLGELLADGRPAVLVFYRGHW